MTDYRESMVPDQTGKTVFITGANTGIGYDTARVLAERGAKILLGCRSEAKASGAIAKIKSIKSDADITWVPLDLAAATGASTCMYTPDAFGTPVAITPLSLPHTV